MEKNLPKIPLIKDPLFEKYIIGLETYNYIVIEPLINSYKTYGYYNSLSSAIKRILTLNSNKKTYNSLKEYINEWEKNLEKLETMFNHIKIEE